MKQRWFGMIAMAACLWLALSPLAQAAGRLTLPSALMSVDEEAFEYVAADELVVPANCASIGAGAFAHSKLRRAYLPSTVTFIGTGAFEDCGSLTCVVEPDSYALSWCAENGVPYEVLESIPAVPVGSIELSNRFIVLGPGETFAAHAAVLPADATIPALQWTIADESVATVDGEGGITAVDEGETTLTASATDGSGAFASCSVRVCPHADYRALLVGEKNFYTDDGDVWGTVPRNAGDTGLMRDMLTSVSAPDGGRYTGQITVAIDLSKAEIHAAIGEAPPGSARCRARSWWWWNPAARARPSTCPKERKKATQATAACSRPRRIRWRISPSGWWRRSRRSIPASPRRRT